jgi:hypothetical protein
LLKLKALVLTKVSAAPSRIVRYAAFTSTDTTSTPDPNCPRKPTATLLHSSKWQGTSALQLCAQLQSPGARNGPALGSLIARTDRSSWVYRENRVPDYQKKFQQHDGVRLWEKVRATLEELGSVAGTKTGTMG